MTEPHKWLQFAREDVVLAEAALERDIFNQTCFHAQQGVEKALKGFLRGRQRSVPKTHSLGELLTLCIKLDVEFSQLTDSCLKLDRYYIPTRYPDALPGSTADGLPTKIDAQEALNHLHQALRWIERKIDF